MLHTKIGGKTNKMVWICDSDDRRENTWGKATHKNGGKTTKGKIQNQMHRPNYKAYRNERENLEENRKWENREFSVIFDPYFWKRLKNVENGVCMPRPRCSGGTIL